jgi:hypothetical protein
MKINAFIAIFLLSACTPLVQSSSNSDSNAKLLKTRDMAYEPQIKTILLHPAFSDPQVTLQPAVTKLGTMESDAFF